MPLKAFRESHGGAGGEVNASTPFAEGILGGTGATIMGRNMFGGGPGPWDDDSWKGWWGTIRRTTIRSSSSHTIPASRSSCRVGRRSTSSRTGSSRRSSKRERRAGGRDVSLGGGASVAQQYLAAGLLDEVVVSVVPILLGGGARLFDNLGDAAPKLEQVEAVAAPGVTHIRYARAGG